MGDYLEKLTSDLRFSAQKKNLSVEFLIGSNSVIDASKPASLGGEKVVRPLYYTQADPDRLREVITNLFDNACKYTDQGKISLGLTGNDSVVQLYIRDTGAGIPPEDIPHLFQKFYRVDNSATRTIGGTGLGLFISRKIVELYQGRIWVESTIGKGSTFYINLPRLTTQKAEQLMTTEATAEVQSVGSLTPDASATTVTPTVPAGTTS
jgi:signal transduction histidine kinase